MLFPLAWVACVTQCGQRGWWACVGGVLAWMAWLGWVVRFRVWRTNVASKLLLLLLLLLKYYPEEKNVECLLLKKN